MILPRFIPTLLIKNDQLYKGEQYKDFKYVGDPVNAIRIFNDKQVDEICFLDISATQRGRINFELINDIASEAFIPFSYGGGISSEQDIKTLVDLGVEKVVLNSFVAQNINFVSKAARLIGSSSVVVKVDYKKNLFGREIVYTNNGNKKMALELYEYCNNLVKEGAGEIILSDISRDGMASGYDIKTLKKISDRLPIPIVASCGAKNLDSIQHLRKETECSAACAGDMFIYYGRFKSVLISYPNYKDLKKSWNKK